jgi:large subunit ribosomal protein L4
MANNSTTPAVTPVMTIVKMEDMGEKMIKSPISLSLLRQVVISYQANLRRATADTKNRGEVSGGGKKPWRQKGTGRARVGSSRTPVWRGGGIVFGPTPERNYTQTITKTAKLKGLAAALTLKIKAGLVKTLVLDAKPTKTKAVTALLGADAAGRKMIVVVPDMDYATAFSNIKGCYVFTPNQLTAGNLIPAHAVIFINDTLETIKTKLA